MEQEAAFFLLENLLSDSSDDEYELMIRQRGPMGKSYLQSLHQAPHPRLKRAQNILVPSVIIWNWNSTKPNNTFLNKEVIK